MARAVDSPERRGSRRFGIGVDVTLTHAQGVLRLQSSNISPGGIKLRAQATGALTMLTADDPVELQFNLPLLSAPVVTAGVICWVQAASLGVQFVDLPARIVSTINRLARR